MIPVNVTKIVAAEYTCTYWWRYWVKKPNNLVYALLFWAANLSLITRVTFP